IEAASLPGGTGQRHGVEKPARPRADPSQPLLRRGRSDQWHQRQAALITALEHPGGLLEWKIGNDQAAGASGSQRIDKALQSTGKDWIAVAHEHNRNALGD